jgi:hypothetical protein
MKKKTKKTKENKQIVEIHIYIHHCYQIPINSIQANPEPLPLSNPKDSGTTTYYNPTTTFPIITC